MVLFTAVDDVPPPLPAAAKEGRLLLSTFRHAHGLHSLLVPSCYCGRHVCRASGNYGAPFKAGRGVTQGGPLSAKLFNILVDAVVREWLRLLKEEEDMEEEEMEGMMETLFAIFYVDDAYIASRDPVFLQQAINGLVSAFERVGLKTNTKKTQSMTCTPGTIRLQLPTDSYLRMRTGRTPAADWDARTVTCRECGKDM